MMENQKYGMAELLAEFGDGFENYQELHRVPEDEEVVQEVEEIKTDENQVVEEEKIQQPKDIIIKCKKCENDFIWSVRDQEFYKEKGFYKPSLCKDCRKKMKVVNNFHKEV